MVKRLIVCCDGTWNSLGMACPTNVVKFSQACKPIAADGTPQILYYDEGLGTSRFVVDKVMGGAFGWGIDENIQDAYRFLCLNYTDGDEIYLFGFSRGAYTVRSLAGMIYCSGLLPHQHIPQISIAYELYRARGDENAPSKDKATHFRQQYGSRQIDITLLGCWDTVGALGIPQLWPAIPINDTFNRKYRFHDDQVNRKIQHALHAMAIDERRKPFDVTHMKPSENANTQIKEVWFPGNHGCVGGGTADLTGLSDAALQWMVDEIAQFGLGLAFDTQWLADNLTLVHNTFFSNASPWFYKLAGTGDRAINLQTEALHPSVEARYRDKTVVPPYRPRKLLDATGWSA